MNKQELENLVKQVYFRCGNKDPQGLYPVEVDLLEFTEKLLESIAGTTDLPSP